MFNRVLLLLLLVIHSMGLSSQDIIPRKIQGEEGRKEAVPHHESLVVPELIPAIVVLIAHWLHPLSSGPLRNFVIAFSVWKVR